MANILTAIINIINNADNKTLRQVQPDSNRASYASNMLEAFVQDAFANSYNKDAQDLTIALSQTFSYIGNKTNPPNMIIKGSDAIEIIKIEKFTALESQYVRSYPKDKIYSDSSLICKFARNCEDIEWKEKSLLYVMGYVPNDTIKILWLVYGDCFCANKSYYEKVMTKIAECVKDIDGIDLHKTSELEKDKENSLNDIMLSIEGKWQLRCPCKAFEEHVEYEESKDLQVFALLKKEKYNEFSLADRTSIESLAKVEEIYIPNPNNKKTNITCKLISYTKQ